MTKNSRTSSSEADQAAIAAAESEGLEHLETQQRCECPTAEVRPRGQLAVQIGDELERIVKTGLRRRQLRRRQVDVGIELRLTLALLGRGFLHSDLGDLNRFLKTLLTLRWCQVRIA